MWCLRRTTRSSSQHLRGSEQVTPVLFFPAFRAVDGLSLRAVCCATCLSFHLDEGGLQRCVFNVVRIVPFVGFNRAAWAIWRSLVTLLLQRRPLRFHRDYRAQGRRVFRVLQYAGVFYPSVYLDAGGVFFFFVHRFVYREFGVVRFFCHCTAARDREFLLLVNELVVVGVGVVVQNRGRVVL